MCVEFVECVAQVGSSGFRVTLAEDAEQEQQTEKEDGEKEDGEKGKETRRRRKEKEEKGNEGERRLRAVVVGRERGGVRPDS